MIDLVQLDNDLNRLADECKALGTPYNIRRHVKDLARMLPTITTAREARASR